MSSKKAPATDSAELREVLDDLCMRFLVNLPPEEYESFERLFFAIEAAHWFYDDFYRDHNPSLPRLPLKYFAGKLFQHTTLLRHYGKDVDKLTAQFQSYKQVVMTCGAALLNAAMDRVVLVRGWGHQARWGFPKGKLAKDETELDAAVRETLEETGFDMSPYVDSDPFYLESFTSGRHCRIYLVTDIPEDTIFETQTRKEISDIQWVPISILPDSPKNAKNLNKAAAGKASSPNGETKMLFAQHGVAPFTKRLRSWIKRRREEIKGGEPVTVGGLPSALTSEELEATLQPVTPNSKVEMAGLGSGSGTSNSNSNGSGSGNGNGNGNGSGGGNGKMMSVGELESTLNAAKHDTPASAKRKSTKSRPRGSTEASSRGSGRKSRKPSGQAEAARNQMTFGKEGGTVMSDRERDKLFHQYVVATDRIAEEKGLRDEFWPVPYVTSKDLSHEQIRAAESARQANVGSRTGGEELGSDSRRSSAGGEVLSEREESGVMRIRDLARPVEQAFAFDRGSILAYLTDMGK